MKNYNMPDPVEDEEPANDGDPVPTNPVKP
jgi:hypothetical protein